LKEATEIIREEAQFRKDRLMGHQLDIRERVEQIASYLEDIEEKQETTPINLYLKFMESDSKAIEEIIRDNAIIFGSVLPDKIKLYLQYVRMYYRKYDASLDEKTRILYADSVRRFTKLLLEKLPEPPVDN